MNKENTETKNMPDVFRTISEVWNPKIDPEEIKKRMRSNDAMATFCQARRLSREEIVEELKRKAMNRRTSGLFVSKQANEWIEEARRRPDPVPLWKKLWFEEEVACLFADTNMGKSILAVQIADDISRRGRKVMYFDFELSDKQFQVRYQDDDFRRHEFAPTFIRAEFSQNNVPDSLEDIVRCIEDEVVSSRCKIVIIDNITWICNRSESGDAAGELMQLLINMKRRWGLSILCLAHTPKRAMTSALTQNSLAGSKRIANFMDSMFAIGMDRTNLPRGRYIKQIKVRSSVLEHGEENVIRCELVKTGGMLRLDLTGTGFERTLLSGNDSDRTAFELQQVSELLGQSCSQAEIARKLGFSTSRVSRLVQKIRSEEDRS